MMNVTLGGQDDNGEGEKSSVAHAMKPLEGTWLDRQNDNKQPTSLIVPSRHPSNPFIAKTPSMLQFVYRENFFHTRYTPVLVGAHPERSG